jgi:hypothetical protein
MDRRRQVTEEERWKERKKEGERKVSDRWIRRTEEDR